MPLVFVAAARLVDGRGGSPIEPGRVLIEGDRIRSVGAALEPPAEAQRYDFPDATILPGLIDCHVHLADVGEADPQDSAGEDDAVRVLRLAQHAARTLRAGVTTVRDVGGRHHLEFGFRRGVEAGLAIAPRLWLCGKIVSMTTPGADMWPGMYRQADGPWEVAKAVREQVKAGADAIKVMATGAIMAPANERPGQAQYRPHELHAAVETAHGLGRRVAAHAHGIEGIRNAVAAGVDTIEHGTYLHQDPSVAAQMAERGIALVPTLKAGALLADPPGPGIPAEIVEKARAARDHTGRSFRLAMEAGVPIAMGTDAATSFNYHGENADELALMVEAGMTPMQAITAATSTAARALGRDHELGTLQPGLLADLIVVRGNPVVDVSLLRQPPQAVFLGGRLVV
ncbi:MAG TPA: amidohydrolase family protein [Candidatus Eisenbacteria bacterium]|nr:amidohydrolase family protein [Candidatus Eisenbacteria bacterium]